MFRKLLLSLAILALGAPALRAAPLFDVMVLIDGSGSVSVPDYETQMTAVQQFLDGFAIGNSANRFGLVQFGNSASLVSGLSGDAAQLSNARSSVVQDLGQTNHAAAFGTAANEFALNGRTGVQQVVVMLTDGNPNVPTPGNPLAAAIAAADDLKTDGALVFAVGIGNFIDPSTLELYASAPSADYAFSIADFSGLGGALADVGGSLNSISGPEASVPAPASLAIAGFGLAALAFARRRARQQAA